MPKNFPQTVSISKTLARAILRSAVGSLFCSIIPISIFPSPSHAVTGFTGAFELNNPPPANFWTFTAFGDNLPPQINCDSYNPATESCLENVNYAGGSISIYAGASTEGGTTDLTWSDTQNTSPYYVSFSLFCSGCNDDNYLTYKVGDVDNGGDTGTLKVSNYLLPVSAYLAPGEIIEFSITNTSNYEGLKVDITNFNAVPAPLPAAGAATAFGYSRRLRRRIKGQRPKGSCPPVTPPHPSLYLNLAPVAVQALPVSFSYTSLPAAAVPHRPAA